MPRRNPFLWLLAAIATLVAPAPAFAQTATAQFGTRADLLFWTPEQQAAGYPAFERVFPTRTIRARAGAPELPRRPIDLSGVALTTGNGSVGMETFMADNHVHGLLVIRDGTIVHERYENGNGPDTRWVSFSVAKSVVSLLVGAAVRDGHIDSVDDPVSKYLPELAGGAYDPVTIRDALRMASAVQWNEDFSSRDADINRFTTKSSADRFTYMSAQPRVGDPGTVYNYNSNEAHLVAAVLRAAIGEDLSGYLSRKIWQPFGMEADGNWQIIEPDGTEYGGCCFSATLRDYGRIGLFALAEGVLPNGEAVLPEGWMAASTTPSPANPGYGYYWWLNQVPGSYSAIGVFGQMIWVDPAENLVIVMHSKWPHPTALFPRAWAFAGAIREALKGDTR